MNLRDRLVRLKEEGKLVVLFFGPHSDGYLARILRVGTDYVEFEAHDAEETVVAHEIRPLGLLAGVTVSSVERAREQLELLYAREADKPSEQPES